MTEPAPPPSMSRGMSLARRMLMATALWSLAILVGGGIALTAVYRAQTISLLEDELESTLVTVTRAVDVKADGRISSYEEMRPKDPRYDTPLSGRYWAIVAVDEEGEIEGDIRPDSMWDGAVPLPKALEAEALAEPGKTFFANTTGPADETVRTAVKAIIVPPRETPVIVVAAADRAPSDAGTRRFITLLIAALTTLAAGVMAAVWASVRLALRPLSRIQNDIEGVREGRQTQLADDYPLEVQPLSDELNKLLDHNREVVSRAKTHVGNLAHALKTPLAVLMNEAKGETVLDDIVRKQSAAMRDNVQHYLKRAQAAARAEALGARADVAPVLESLAGLLTKLFTDKGITVTARTAPGAVFRGEKQDLEEMVGNLMENACKWAATKVTVTASSEDSELVIHIDDDGKGLSPVERADALKRGVRLDENAPGTGLGLSIVTEIAQMHKGALTLSDSPYGGLRATLRLPAL